MKYGKRPETVTEQNVSDYRLSEAAKEDLIGIALYGDERFGASQSNRYRDQLKHRFSVLAAQPLLAPTVEYISAGYRRSVCGVHSIYYRIEGDGIEIIRVLGRQDTKFIGKN
jgi:toxin ParE1/3/4